MRSNYDSDNENYELLGDVDDDSRSVNSDFAMSICALTEYAESDREGEGVDSEHELSEYDGDDDGGPQFQDSEHDEADSPIIRPIRCAFRVHMVTTLKLVLFDTIDTVLILRGILWTQVMGRSNILCQPVHAFESTTGLVDIVDTSRMRQRLLLRRCIAHHPYNTAEIGVDLLDPQATRTTYKLRRAYVLKRSNHHRKTRMKTG
jgi:hypothetical protein